MGDPSGPGGIARDGVVLYIAIGVGDAVQLGTPGTEIPTRKVPLHRSFILGPGCRVSADIDIIRSSSSPRRRLANATIKAGNNVVKTNSEGVTATIRLLADFPDYIPVPIPQRSPFEPVCAGAERRTAVCS